MTDPDGSPAADVADATHPITPLAGPIGHPVHPILVTVPIGAWVSSLVFDAGARVSDSPVEFTHGARWLIAVGIVGAIVAAVFGLADLLTIPRGSKAWRTGLTHMALNVAVLAVFAVDFVWRYSERDRSTESSVGQIALSAVALAALAVSGYLGGQLTYRAGVRVADEDTQAEELTPTESTADTPTETPANPPTDDDV